MKLIKNKRAQGTVVSWFIGIAIAVVVALAVVWPVTDGALNGGAGAYSTLTLSGNVSCNQLVNVTNGAGAKAIFEFNITSGGCTATTGGQVAVTLGADQNTSTIAATNLTTALNANATISGTMTATNPSAGVVRLTYKTKGQAGSNAGIVLSETLAAGSWSGNTLSNGVSDSTTMPASAQTLIVLIPLFIALVLLMILIRPLL